MTSQKSRFTTKDGQETKLQSGDLVVYDITTNAIRFLRDGQALLLDQRDGMTLLAKFPLEVEALGNIITLISACCGMPFKNVSREYTYDVAIQFL